MSWTVRTLGFDDITDALGLCRAAGWNQQREDWRRLLDHEPEGCFAAVVDGRLLGTVTTTRYGSELAWIGMMLVDDAYRRQGIATELIRVSLDYLDRRGTRCVKLDATPAGELVYRRLGFQPEWAFQRWMRPAQDHGGEPVALRNDSLRDAHLQLDKLAFGVDRADFLGRLAASSQTVVHNDGFGMSREGHLADYLGPVVARDASVATALIGDLLDGATRPVFWDIPHQSGPVVDLARALNFEPVRDLTRMWWGSDLFEPDMAWQYALADPGTG